MAKSWRVETLEFSDTFYLWSYRIMGAKIDCKACKSKLDLAKGEQGEVIISIAELSPHIAEKDQEIVELKAELAKKEKPKPKEKIVEKPKDAFDQLMKDIGMENVTV